SEHDQDDHGERRAPTTAAAPLLAWLVGLLGAGIVLLVGSAAGIVGAGGAPRWLLGATGRWGSTGTTHVWWETTGLACDPGRRGGTARRGWGGGGRVARLRPGGGLLGAGRLLYGRKAARVRAGGRSCGGLLITGCGWLRPRIRLRAGCG